MNEIWKDVAGYEGLYQISNMGRVKTMPRTRVHGGILKYDCCKGYYRVSLSKYGKSKHYFVHRLVAQEFIPNPNNFNIINHKDENPQNNCVDNLEWCTHVYNLMYGNRRAKVIEKERKPVNRYSMNGDLIQTHYSIQQAARDIQRNASPIYNCCSGKQTSAYGYLWSYADKGGDV